MGRRPDQTFFQRVHTDGQQAHEKMLNITNYGESENKNHNEVSPHTCFRMAIIKKYTNNKSWQGCGENRTLIHCRWECILVQPLWETSWMFLKKWKTELPYDPAIPLLGIYPKKTPNTLIQKDSCTPKLTGEIFTIAKIWKEPKCSQQVDGQRRSGMYIYVNVKV